ncbi:hypothetical protein HOD30_00075 [Candidatus Peregrinibacteria bacterium]|jgi:hypothetical protein|nr:hypothetical protein [Candidatus Peregrinibacteria bacterium]MBT4632398.1 hypothetical protein [Candidatus Peregrinibacteria bacterium]MBT5517041.1 hypothetical protein [Candidatus Peregrinibacteria bacterium]MBT5823602.1 hypothetical protein [Candidatus Peregrinibacteria bacterium]
MNKIRLSKKHIFWGAGAAAAFILLTLAVTQPFSFKKELIRDTREVLLNSLKNPADAKFIGKPDVLQGEMEGIYYCGSMGELDGKKPENPAENFYTVQYTVDATNGYGAIVRSDYVCVVNVLGTTCKSLKKFNDYRDMCNDYEFRSLMEDIGVW